MKHKRFSDEQVIGVLKEHEAAAKVDEICRRHAISTATFCRVTVSLQVRVVSMTAGGGGRIGARNADGRGADCC